MGVQLDLFAARAPAALAVREPIADDCSEEAREQRYQELLEDVRRAKSARALCWVWGAACDEDLGTEREQLLRAALWERADRMGVSASTARGYVESGAWPPRRVT